MMQFVEMGSGVAMYTESFTKSDTAIQKLIVGDSEAQGQLADCISLILLLLFQSN
jgi:hypothetical protein